MTFVVVLVQIPAVDPVTVTLYVHVPSAGSDTPLRVIIVGVTVMAAAGHPADVTGPVAVMPAGRLSTKPTPVNAAVVFGFVSAN